MGNVLVYMLYILNNETAGINLSKSQKLVRMPVN